MSQAKLRALQQWCKNRCEGYRDVKITNMTTSWRDGLAFCALIHRFRPDLINFDSLCKENVYYNNNLAFTVAEQLGVTALLEAKDMEELKVPDKLSIITYVASLYNYFKDKEKLGGPDVQKCKSHISIGMKRHPDSDPYDKFEPKRLTPSKEDNTKKGSSTPTKQPSGGDYCVLCKDKVYLIEKHIEDGNLYHRSCFRKSYMSPTSKILTDYSTQKQTTTPSPITINSIDKTTSNNMDSSKNDPSANAKSLRLKGKLFDKKKDQVQKAEERLRSDKQYKKEMEEEQMINNGRKNSSSALKAHLKGIDSSTKKSSTNLPENSFPQHENRSSYNSEKTFQTSPYRDSNLHERSDSQKRETNDLTFSTVSVKSAAKPESDPSLDTPMLMKEVSSRTMGDKKMQATMHHKSVSNLKDNSEQYVVSGLLKSLAGIRQRQSTSSSPTNSDPPSPLPTEPAVPNIKLSQTSTSTVTNSSTIKSLSGDNSQNFKNPHLHLNKSKTSLINSTEKESDVITAHTNHQNKPQAALNSSSKSEQESTNSTSTASSSFTPRKQTRASLRVQLPSIQQRIKDYSKVAPGIGDQPTDSKKPDDVAKSDKNNVPPPSFPLSTIMKNEQNLKPHQEINRGHVAMDIPSSGGITAASSKNNFEISKTVKPNALSESAADIHSTHSAGKSLVKPRGKHLGNDDANSPASGVITTKLHPGHMSPANKGSLTIIDDRVNPIPKPRREKIGLRTETAKENKENPSALKTIPEAFERIETPHSEQNTKTEVKTEWQLEAERRIATRKVEGYVDPEVKHLNVNNNRISQNSQSNGDVNESVSTGQRRRIPVTRTFTFTINDTLPNQPETSLKSDTKKKTFTSSEIPLEVVDIDAKLRELELKGRQLEDIIRATICDDEYDRKMTEWFNIINEKNELVRKEHYLVFHLEEQELLKEQVHIDHELQELQNSRFAITA
ncbi:MICAL-like protein 2 isoform X2 [Octopus bimaculoides]|uniref:MICAL-like protein 2 isoform X2 n=1 Tax=Octopus bimaculoides TaxID=37653 RepID=UPI00071D77B0|nr:MICAL-like protein 2 isoform X2 [Octopus bimaculoides]|eukprot:XP_014773587.1 PREDICTED: MICAL-like protein 2 isoform X2 [Octopus bimaculoides]